MYALDINMPVQILSNLTKAIGLPSLMLGSSVWLLRQYLPPAIASVLAYVSMSGLSVAIAANSIVSIPSSTTWLGKDHTTGQIPLAAYLLQWPYHALLHARIARRRHTSREPLYSLVAPDIYLGGWPRRDSDLPHGGKLARLDMTAELPARGHGPYLNVPLYDTQGPSAAQTQQAVQWASAQRAKGVPLYVFCQNGHGRSGVVAAALLVELGLAGDGEEALRLLKGARPKVRFNAAQAEAMKRWEAMRRGRE